MLSETNKNSNFVGTVTINLNEAREVGHGLQFYKKAELI